MALTFSICIPVYKGSALLKTALESILCQEFKDYEIIIGDDNPPSDPDEIERTRQVVASFNDPRISYVKHPENLGYPGNLRAIAAMAKNDILFLMAQDDILSRDSLQRTHDAFMDPEVGVVTRPFFMFIGDWRKPVRAIGAIDEEKDRTFTIHDDEAAFLHIMFSASQLSGLAYRRKFLEVGFHDEIFPAHIYPFAGIFRKHKCVFLKDYTVAARIESSQTRTLPTIYNISPTESWIKMYKTIFTGDQYKTQLLWGIRDRAKNYVGLIQIRNYGSLALTLREIKIMLSHHWPILFDPMFWVYAVGVTALPPVLLRPLSDAYKKRVLARSLPKIRFNYS